MTNMWGKVNPEVGEARERQLSTLFFKSAIDKGARLLRHDNTVESAHAIIHAILNNNDPLALQIQEELVDKHMKISQTGVGQEICWALDGHAEKLKDEIKELQIELQNAEERETQQELEEEVRASQQRLVSVRAESMELEVRYQAQRDYMRDRTDRMFSILPLLLVALGLLLLPPLLLGPLGLPATVLVAPLGLPAVLGLATLFGLVP